MAYQFCQTFSICIILFGHIAIRNARGSFQLPVPFRCSTMHPSDKRGGYSDNELVNIIIRETSPTNYSSDTLTNKGDIHAITTIIL